MLFRSTNDPKSEEEVRYNPHALMMAKHLGTELNACPCYWPRKKGKIERQEQSSGDVYNFNIELQAIGTKLTSSQADGIIEPIIKSAERYGKKKGIKVNVGRS